MATRNVRGQAAGLNADRAFYNRQNEKLKILQQRLDNLTGYTKADGTVVPPQSARTGTFNQFQHSAGSDVHQRQIKSLSKEILKIQNNERYFNYANKLQTQEANKIQQEIDAGVYKGVSEGSGIVQEAPSAAFPSTFQPTADTLRSQELNYAFSPQAMVSPQPWQIGENLKGLNINFDYNADKIQNPGFYTQSPAGQELNPAYMDEINRMSEASAGIEYPVPTGGGAAGGGGETSGDTATTTKQSTVPKSNTGHKNYDEATTATGGGALRIQKKLLDAGFKQSELNALANNYKKNFGKRKGLLSIFKKGG